MDDNTWAKKCGVRMLQVRSVLNFNLYAHYKVGSLTFNLGTFVDPASAFRVDSEVNGTTVALAPTMSRFEAMSMESTLQT